MPRTPTITRRTLIGLMAIVAAAVALSACGSGSVTGSPPPSTTTTAAPAKTPTPTRSRTLAKGKTPTKQPANTSGSGSGKGSTTTSLSRSQGQPAATTVPARTRSGQTAERTTRSHAIPVNPCSYVTAAEAAAAFHTSSVTATVGQLGPTCIFTSATGKRQLGTLAIGSANVNAEAKVMRNPTREAIAGHRGVCGTLGSSLLLLELGGDRTLSIQAPCLAARTLASKALPRIKG